MDYFERIQKSIDFIEGKFSFPVLQSQQLILKKIEEIHLQELYVIYDNEHVFQYCGIIPKHNIQQLAK